MTQGQLYHSAEGLGLGKKHTKVQPRSMKVTQVMTSKRNADVKVNVNLNVNSKRLLDSCYEHEMLVRMNAHIILAKPYIPHSYLRQAGALKKKTPWD